MKIVQRIPTLHKNVHHHDTLILTIILHVYA